MDKDFDTVSGDIEHKRRFWLKSICFASGAVVLPPVVGTIITMIAMKGAFESLSDTGARHGVGILDKQIGVALSSTAIGSVVAVLALMFLIFSLIRYFTLPKSRV